MTARENIISAVGNNKPAKIELQEIDLAIATKYNDPVKKFASTLESIGGIVVDFAGREQLNNEIANDRRAGHLVIDTVGEEISEIFIQKASELESVYKVYIRAEIGVAENGAVWIPESRMGNRLLPFICQHLVIILEINNIVSTMHDAYNEISCFNEGFGVFIAGPSKTADIEQSLVIGAHGARSLRLLLRN